MSRQTRRAEGRDLGGRARIAPVHLIWNSLVRVSVEACSRIPPEPHGATGGRVPPEHFVVAPRFDIGRQVLGLGLPSTLALPHIVNDGW